MPLDSMQSIDATRNQAVLMEVDNYEALLVDSIASGGVVVLQELIKQSELPEKCKQMQKPRRFFAAKMFMATLSKYFQVLISHIFCKYRNVFGSLKIVI